VLRCSDCFKRYVADLPEGVKEDEKFDETAEVAIGLYKYSGGIPFYPQARMQESCSAPLPESVQFERYEEMAKDEIIDHDGQIGGINRLGDAQQEAGLIIPI
jgi:hypothetical protein